MNWVSNHPVLACERRRQQALLEGGGSLMAALLAHDLRYTHASGITHDREAYLAYLQSGPVFEHVHVDQALVLESADLAVLKGQLQMRFRRAGETQSQSAQSVLTQVWRRCEAGWQLVVFQSTKEASPT
jgi:ketosteroid isomerase-like protein